MMYANKIIEELSRLADGTGDAYVRNTIKGYCQRQNVFFYWHWQGIRKYKRLERIEDC